MLAIHAYTSTTSGTGGAVTPFDVAPNSHDKAWWVCDKGHEWEAVIRNRNRNKVSECRYCSSFGIVNPELAKQWHPSKNGAVTPFDVAPNSHDKAWWVCDKGHEWEAVIYHRNNGTGCRYCYKLNNKGPRKPKKGKSLNDKTPELAKQWHPHKNGALTPSDVSYGSGEPVWWICDKGHEWDATVNHRNKGRGCRYCYKNESFTCARIRYELKHIFTNINFRKKIFNQECDIFLPDYKIGIEYDGAYYHGGKETNNQNQKEQFEKTKNKKETLEKNDIKIIFVREKPLKKLCESDLLITPEDDESMLFEVLKKLLKHKKLEKIKFSENEKNNIKEYLKRDYPNPGFINDKDYLEFRENGIDEIDSLKFKNPELAKQWHPTKNGKWTPRHVTPNSKKKVWWVCDKGHEWPASVKHRNNGRGCRYCYKLNNKGPRKPKKGKSLNDKNPELAKQWHPYKNGALTPSDVSYGSGTPVWWICDKGHEWSAVVGSRNRGNGCRECDKLNRKKNVK